MAAAAENSHKEASRPKTGGEAFEVGSKTHFKTPPVIAPISVSYQNRPNFGFYPVISSKYPGPLYPLTLERAKSADAFIYICPRPFMRQFSVPAPR
ncbi:MAG: hypothetical protein HC902_04490 [Calothrix sp. SM1_5_4]|nr:hypothetical protein [Calothrix sp. SM1_5_4]